MYDIKELMKSIKLYIKPPIEIEWTQDLYTNLDVIDNQHREIISLINDLYTARFNQDKPGVDDVLARLIEHMNDHCRLEEELMIKSGFPDAQSHAETHRKIEMSICNLVKHHLKGDDVGGQLQHILFSWLDHIRKEDLLYVNDVKRYLDQQKAWVYSSCEAWYNSLMLEYLTDGARHLICLPYSIDNLHEMARQLDIKPCWFHRDHYDIPKRRIIEIEAKCRMVSSREIVRIVRPHRFTW